MSTPKEASNFPVVASATNAPVAQPARPLPTHTLVNGDGVTVEIGRHVVAKIVGLAVREVAGVHAVVPRAGDRLAQLADKVTGSDSHDIGVHVEIGMVECAADVHIICDYGADVPAVAAQIRDVARARIKKMTGLHLKELELHIEDLFFATETRKTGRELK